MFFFAFSVPEAQMCQHIFGLLDFCVSYEDELRDVVVLNFRRLSSFAQSCVKSHLSMLESTYCLVCPATGCMKNELQNVLITTARTKVSDCVYRLRHCDIPSSAA